MEVKVKKLKPEATLPSYAHPGDAGLDFYAAEDMEIPPNERRTIATGIALEIPEGHVLLMWDKSGLAGKSGLTSLAGVIDAGYRGEIKIVIYNTGKETYTFKIGDKVAQGLIQTVTSPEITEVDELSGSVREDGGFGSTGK